VRRSARQEERHQADRVVETMTEHGGPEVPKSPSQKTAEQRVEESENDADDALLGMSQSEEKRR
jgi:hypothetical protein